MPDNSGKSKIIRWILAVMVGIALLFISIVTAYTGMLILDGGGFK